MHAPEPAHLQLPAWLRRTHGEHRWPAALAVVVAIGCNWCCLTGWCRRPATCCRRWRSRC